MYQLGHTGVVAAIYLVARWQECLKCYSTRIYNQVARVVEVNVGGSLVALISQPSTIHIWAMKEARL